MSELSIRPSFPIFLLPPEGISCWVLGVSHSLFTTHHSLFTIYFAPLRPLRETNLSVQICEICGYQEGIPSPTEKLTISRP